MVFRSGFQFSKFFLGVFLDSGLVAVLGFVLLKRRVAVFAKVCYPSIYATHLDCKAYCTDYNYSDDQNQASHKKHVDKLKRVEHWENIEDEEEAAEKPDPIDVDGFGHYC